MTVSPLLVLHISGGTVGFLSGAAAVTFRKGSQQHAMAGDVFVVGILTLAATGSVLAIMKRQPGNILGGIVTFYLVATAWMTARRKTAETGPFDWIGLLVAASVAVVEITFGIEAATSATGLKYDYPPGPYFMLGSVALLATVGDIRMLARGGVSGATRLARHLWRMCFALFIAGGSIFLARQQLFPELMRKTGMLTVLTVFPLILMIYWLVRVLALKYATISTARKLQEKAA
jgi:hypothetical protein